MISELYQHYLYPTSQVFPVEEHNRNSNSGGIKNTSKDRVKFMIFDDLWTMCDHVSSRSFVKQIKVFISKLCDNPNKHWLGTPCMISDPKGIHNSIIISIFLCCTEWSILIIIIFILIYFRCTLSIKHGKWIKYVSKHSYLW